MLRSVFLRFPLFIHPPFRRSSAVRREKTHARPYAPIHTRVRGTEGYTYTTYYIRRRRRWRAPCRKTDNIFAGQKTAAVEDLRRCERHPSRRCRVQDQLHRPGRMARSHWSGARTVTPGPHLPAAGIPYTSLAVTTRDTRSGVIDVFRPPRVHAHIYYQKRRRQRWRIYAEHLLYIIMTVFRKRSFRILYPSSVPHHPVQPLPRHELTTATPTPHRHTSI